MKTAPEQSFELLNELLQGVEAFLLNEDGYLKILSPPYMDLVIERLSDNTLSLTHYYKQNGDLIPDPDMTVEIDPSTKIVNAKSFQNLIVYREVESIKKGKLFTNRMMQFELNQFLLQWLRNLKDQGFFESRYRKTKP